MVQAVSQLMSFQEFLAWKPETGRYELHDGVVVEMQPTGPHVREASPEEKQVVGLLNRKLNALLDQEDLNFFIPNTAMVQPLGYQTGYKHCPSPEVEFCLKESSRSRAGLGIVHSKSSPDDGSNFPDEHSIPGRHRISRRAEPPHGTG